MRTDARFAATMLAVIIAAAGGAGLAIKQAKGSEPFLFSEEVMEQTRLQTPYLHDTVPDGGYFIREENGVIAVYASSNEEKPQLTLDTDITALTQQERENLRLGISANSYGELMQLLDNYNK